MSMGSCGQSQILITFSLKEHISRFYHKKKKTSFSQNSISIFSLSIGDIVDGIERHIAVPKIERVTKQRHILIPKQ